MTTQDLVRKQVLLISKVVFSGLLLILLNSCAHKQPKHIRVLEYADFGPQAMAYPLIGKDQPKDSSTLIDKPVYVIVYHDIPLKKVKKKYKSDPEKNLHYRYIPLVQALEYLDSNIAKNYWSGLTQRLQTTRKSLSGLEPASAPSKAEDLSELANNRRASQEQAATQSNEE